MRLGLEETCYDVGRLDVKKCCHLFVEKSPWLQASHHVIEHAFICAKNGGAVTDWLRSMLW